MAAAVLLGDIGRPLPEAEQVDLRLSRLGGVPSWPLPPISSNAPMSDKNDPCGTCGCCGEPRSFVAQLNASYDGAPGGPCRLLYLYACLSRGCDGHDAAWKVLRVTSPLHTSGGVGAISQVEATTDFTLNDDAPTNVESWSADDWGADSSHSVTAQELEALLAARSNFEAAAAVVEVPKADDAAKSDGLGVWRGKLQRSSAQERWPSFSLVIYEEPPEFTECGTHELELLERYRQSELATEDGDDLASLLAGPPADTSDDCSEMGRRAGCVEEGDDTDSWLLRFHERLERSPSQVVRYSWGGRPLWISEPPEETTNSAWPPACRCGSPRVFEMQLLPTLFSQVRKRCPELLANADIEWGTVLVYTCARDCLAEDTCEEFVLVQPAI